MQQRQRWMAVLARASLGEMDALLAACPALPGFAPLRGPEAGLVMLRGRAGGAGAAFNLGEMTVVRCSVRDVEGRVGHAYVQGRDGARAERAARIDAAMQSPARHDALEAGVIAPLEQAQARRRAAEAERAAATRVQFFTMSTMRS